MSPGNLWDKHAVRWNALGAPLRPSAQDIEIMQDAVARHSEAAGRPATAAVLLGVTPEIATMRWPRPATLRAFDRNPSMIEFVWPGNREIDAEAVCAIWTNLPIAGASCDVVVGDASFTNLHYPGGYLDLTREIHRILKPDGLLVARFFTRPPRRESAESIVAELVQGGIQSFHAFKLRLAAALQNDVQEGVVLADVWEVWHRIVPNPDDLALKLGWPRATIGTIDNYREISARYTFPSIEEIREVFSPHFEETSLVQPDYELGECCPIFQFSPRKAR